MTTLLQRATQHDDSAEGKWLWSSKGDKSRIIGSVLWLSWSIGIDVSRDWDTLSFTAMFGPFSLSYMTQRPHVWGDR